ncbi:hypothetical protein [Paenibacillus sp. TC-CSREp1]|uniref:hypothetical protein n=1 Tax=Paenibacillus sp. TC-CSREp1 TaxID=3410089 RepID=UPI003D044393
MQLKPLLECGLTLGGWIGFGAAVGPGFLRFPSMGEIPDQTRTLRCFAMRHVA